MPRMTTKVRMHVDVPKPGAVGGLGIGCGLG
jgi:hypothetical protein